MPLQQTSGNDTSDAYGGGVAAVPNYIESVFSTYLYTGNGSTSTQTIPNGIDESGKGALTWFKKRSTASSHLLFDTNRGTDSPLATNSTSGQGSGWSSYFNFLSNGVSVSDDLNVSGTTYASWTFRKQPKFFDVVTYTGNSRNRTIAHNLGSAPGMIIVKNLTSAMDWIVYHTATGATQYLSLNTTAAATTSSAMWNNTAPTSTVFSLGTDFRVNNDTDQFVAYIYAHNAGGFGLTGTDNVISCGSYTGTGAAGNVITLGYEPQWILAKAAAGGSAGTQYWQMYDTMRGMSVGAGNDAALYPNVSNAEATGQNGYSPTATGFETDGSNSNLSGVTYIYIAIRRGPMKVPTDATKVFKPDFLWGTDPNVQRYLGYVSDFNIVGYRSGNVNSQQVSSRLTGANGLVTSSTNAEVDFGITWDSMLGSIPISGTINTSYTSYAFRRAPGFFDEVCYTGDAVADRQVNHNLTVIPEFIITKHRTTAGWDWYCYSVQLGLNKYIVLNSTAAAGTSSGFWTTMSTSTFGLGSSFNSVNSSGDTFVAYLFASCPGVSKVFSFTGNGTTQTINCGFTGGARFVLLKATSTTGGWFVYDTARGMTTLTDPYLQLNSTAAETATLGSVTTVTTGFAVNESILTGVNTNGVSYIGLAVA